MKSFKTLMPASYGSNSPLKVNSFTFVSIVHDAKGLAFFTEYLKSSLPSSMWSARDIFLTSLNRFFIVKPAYCIHAAIMLDGQYYSVANYYLNRNYKYFIILIGGKFCPQLKICSFA